MSRIPLSRLSDREVHSLATDTAAKDRLSTVGMLRVVGEVERRQLFVPLGFTSIFDYCTRHLKFASSSAMRKIEVARVLRRFPDTAVLLESGDVNESTLSLVAGVLTEENHQKLLEQIRGKSQRDVEGIVSLHKPPVKLKDRVRPVMVAVERADRSAVGLRQPTTEDTGIAAHEREASSCCSSGNASAPAGDSEAPILGQTSQNPCNSLIFHSRCGSDGDGQAVAPPRPGTQTPATAATVHDVSTPTSHPAPTRTVLERRFQIQFLAGPAFMKKLEQARALLSNRLDDPTFERVFEAMIDEFLERHSPESKIARREIRQAKKAAAGGVDGAPAPRAACEHGRGNRRQDPRRQNRRAPRAAAGNAKKATRMKDRERQLKEAAKRSSENDVEGTSSRRIPAPVRDRVFTRDKGQCTYVSPGGQRCGSTHHLQIDHITPFGRGGKSTENNLRLLCGRHNRLEAERIFGACAARPHRRR